MSRLRLWTPERRTLELQLLLPEPRTIAFERKPNGCFEKDVDAPEGSLYRLKIGDRELPDPASRFQPFGVHGPSQIVDPCRFRWHDSAWRGPTLEELSIYELHIGTFTPEGTFRAATTRLRYLRELGVTAVELMPLGEFPGRRGWGYDGVDLGAPAHIYGTPDDLRTFVDAAHSMGLAVLLDFVCNHLGPDGNYLPALSRHFFTEKHSTPWGSAVNFDGPESAAVRRFFLETARRWIEEYHLDGLRFDATHAIYDDSPQNILTEISSTLRGEFLNKRLLFIAEDERKLAKIVLPGSQGGWGLDGVWSDDFHHCLRRLLAGDREGYFGAFAGTVEELAGIVERGWRSAPQRGVRRESRIFCIQNHDQVGNRAYGERLNHQIDAPAYRAASALLLACPQTPLLFMGQEWAADSPFQYFTDLEGELGRRVTEGRREEFKRFREFRDPNARRSLPDPQAESTFLRSKLDWNEIQQEPHASFLRLYRAMLALRRSQPALRGSGALDVRTYEGSLLLLRRPPKDGATIAVAVQLKGTGRLDLPRGDWATLLSTEDPRFTSDPSALEGVLSGPRPFFRFARPGAVFLSLNANGERRPW